MALQALLEAYHNRRFRPAMIRPDAPYCSSSRRHRRRGAEKTRERCGQGHYAPSRSCNRCPPFSIARTDRNAFEASGEDIPCFVFCGIKAHRRFVWTNLSFSPPTASISARNSYHRGPILPVFVSYLPPYSPLARLPTTLDTPPNGVTSPRPPNRNPRAIWGNIPRKFSYFCNIFVQGTFC